MTSRPSTRKRKPGVAAHGLRQTLIRSESAAVPKASEILLKPKATLGAEPGGLAEESYKSKHEPGLLNKSPNKEEPALVVQEGPIQTQIDVVSKKRVQHRVWVEKNHDEGSTEVPSRPRKPAYSDLLETLKNLRKIEQSHKSKLGCILGLSPAFPTDPYGENGEIPPKLKDNVSVPKTLKFLGETTEFRCKFTIENTSERTLTYTVKSTSLSKFEIEPTVGWIRPKSKARISIKTRSRYVQDFKDISSERFVVFAAPIFIEQLLAMEKLQIYWRTFGSALFPRWLAEVHRIDTLVPEDKTCLSVLDLVGIHRRRYHKELEHNFGAIDPETFYKIWEVNGTMWSQNLALEYQYREFIQNMSRNEKIPFDYLSTSLKTGGLIAISVLGYFTIAACTGLPYGLKFFQFFWDRVFGPIFSVFYRNPPPPPAWYESLYFWRWF